MFLMSCRDVSWGAVQYGGSNLEGCAGVQLLLCRQFDVARAVRHGLRPAAVRGIENAIHPALHEYFGKIRGIGFKKAPSFRCDICQLIDAAKRVARSNYAEDFAEYLNETRADEIQRYSYDLAGVFQKYINSVGQNNGRRLMEQMTRAVTVMQKIHDFILATSIRAPEPSSNRAPDGANSSEDYLECMADEMALLRSQLKAIDQPSLRIVR